MHNHEHELIPQQQTAIAAPTIGASELKILLAVKGRADNIDLLDTTKSFTEIKTEIINPRSIDNFLKSLDETDYDLIICDHQLIKSRTFSKLAKLKEKKQLAPLVTFTHTSTPAKTLECLFTFVVDEFSNEQLQKLIGTAMQYALLNKSLALVLQNTSDNNLISDAYSYHARIDSSGHLSTDWVSESFQSVTGYQQKEVNQNGGWISFVHPEDVPTIKKFITTLLDNRSTSVVYRARNKSNATIWLESVGKPQWSNNEKRVIGVSGKTRNVTEREQLRSALNAFGQQQNTIVKITEIAAADPDPAALFKQATLLLTQDLDAWLCEIFIIDDEDPDHATLKAAMGLESELIDKLQLTTQKDNELAYLLKNDSGIICQNLRQEKRFKPSPHLRKHKALSGICVPLKAASRTLGMLAVYSNQTDAFTAHHLNFVQSAAIILAVLYAQKTNASRLRTTREALVEQTQKHHHKPDNTLFTDSRTHHDDDISIIVKTAKELRSRDMILSATSHATKILIDATSWPDVMNDVLSKLGMATSASRAYLFSNHIDLAGDQFTSLSYEWANKGITPCIDQKQYKTMSLDQCGLGRFSKILSEGGSIVGHTDELEKQERAYFKKSNVQSTAMVPIFVRGHWWGFLGFDACHHKRDWSSAEVDALAIAANTIASALERKQNETAMQAILESTVGKTGDEYFRSLLKHLAFVFDADYCLIAEIVSENLFEVRYALNHTEFLNPFKYRQKNSFFTESSSENIIHYPSGVYREFPENTWLKDNKVEGYLAIPILDNSKNTLGHIAVMSSKRLDVTARDLQIIKIFAARVGVEMERQQMEAENFQLARISLENPNMVMVADLEGKITFSNPACAKMQSKLKLENIKELLPENHQELVQEALKNNKQLTSIERSISEYNFQWNYFLQSDLNRVNMYAVDLTQYRLIEDQLRKDAFQDSLTNLPNRNFFNKLLTHAIERTTRRNDYSFAVLFLDLDRFKYINDSLGHAYGDKFLEIVSQLLKNCLRPGDYIARFGGDEFAILLDGVTDEQEATNIADRIQQSLAKPILLDHHETFTSASIGIALSNLGYDNPQDILRDADIAMYSAKQSGKAKHTVFDARMHDDMVHVLRLETDLRNALKNDELCVYYQPIYSITEQCLIGLEALVRWQHPEKGFLEPDDFVPLAEEMSIIRDIDYLVLNRASKQLSTWHKKYPFTKNLKMHINLSAIHFNNTAILAEIGNALKDNGLSVNSLQLELTEGVLMSNTNRSAEIFNVLNTLGINISIDDFGVGYSSLSRLTKLPIDILKIDKGFVQSMVVDSSSLNITRAIIDLAHDLDMEVIAEGVETQGQLQILGRMGCHYAQGYYIAKPLTAEKAEALLVNPPKL